MDQGGVDGCVAGGTLRDAGTIVDDVLMAVGALAVLLLPLTLVMEILAEGEGDTAPTIVGEVVFGTVLHTVALMLETTTGHAVTGRVGLHAAAQALVMTALVILGTGSVFAMKGTHSLAVVLCPAAFTEVSVDGGRLAGGLSDSCPWTHVSTLSVVLVSHDVVVLDRVQDLGPVQSGEIAEIRVLLKSHSSSGDVHQAVEADLSQL